VFFTSPRVRAPTSDKEWPAPSCRSGKTVKGSSLSKAGTGVHSKQPTPPHVKPSSTGKELPAFPYRSGKIILGTSPKPKVRGGARSKQASEPSWLDNDDIFSFDAED